LLISEFRSAEIGSEDLFSGHLILRLFGVKLNPKPLSFTVLHYVAGIHNYGPLKFVRQLLQLFTIFLFPVAARKNNYRSIRGQLFAIAAAVANDSPARSVIPSHRIFDRGRM
jgi:hypothetical protein